MRAAEPVLRLYPALSNGPFLLLWLGMMPSFLAVMMNMIVSPYAAFTVAQTAAILGFVSLAQNIPMLLLSLVGGVMADRLPRRFVLMGSQTALGVAAGGLAVVCFVGRLEIWHIIVASILQGGAFAFNVPARQAYIAELVPRPVLPNASALHSAGQNFCRVAGPALGGVLLALPWIGIGGAYVVIALLYATALFALLRLPGGMRGVARVSDAGYLLEGLRYVRSSNTIVALIGMNLVVVMFGMVYQTLMPVVAERTFGVSAEGLGILLAGSGMGALIGGVMVASMSRFSHPALLQLGLAVGLGVALVGFSMTRSFPLGVGLLVLIGFLNSSFSALNNTLLMANSEARLTGRVMSFYLLTWGVQPLGALPLAWLADRAGVSVSIALAGVLLALAVVGIALLHPATQRINWVSAAQASD